MKMKKMIALGAVVALTLSVAACGNNNTSSADSSKEDVDTASSNASAEAVEETVETNSETGSGEELGEDTDTSTGDYSETYPRPNADKVMGDDVSAEATYSPTEEILNATATDIKIQIGDTVYAPGSTIKDLFYGDLDVKYKENGYDEVTAPPSTLVFPGDKTHLYIYNGSDFCVKIPIENPSDENINLEDCVIASNISAPSYFGGSLEEGMSFSGVSDSYFRENNNDVFVWLPGGITYKSTFEDVKDALGEPYASGEPLDLNGNPSSEAGTICARYFIPGTDGNNYWLDFTFQQDGAYISGAGFTQDDENILWNY